MRNTIAKIDPTYPIAQAVNDELLTPAECLMTTQFRLFILQVQERGLLIGTGSPEGVVEAQQGVEYMDETGGVGAVKYIKQSADIAGDRTRGWVAI